MATAKFIHDGNSIDYTPSADVAAGDVVVQGESVGIAKTAIAANLIGAIAVTGVFDGRLTPACLASVHSPSVSVRHRLPRSLHVILPTAGETPGLAALQPVPAEDARAIRGAGSGRARRRSLPVRTRGSGS